MFPLCNRRSECLLELETRSLHWRRHVGHVEEGNLQSQLSPGLGSLSAEPNDGVLVVGVQVAGEARDFEFS